ncbi:MAG TPA: anti-sigma factor RsbA family regulatory protein [Solirubrobacterales bacterium]
MICEHGDSFRHEALFYDDDDAFLDGTLEFIEAGAAAGEPMLVVVDSRKIGMLRGELNGDTEQVSFLDMEQVGQNPARIIPLWREFVDANVRPGAGARGIGEPVWPARTAAELAECQLHEALLNVAFDDGDAWSLLCPYDSSAFPEDVLEEARRSHPVLTGSGGELASPAFDADAVPRPFDGELPEPAGPVSELRFGAADVAAARAFVMAHAEDAGLERVSIENLVLAVSELATNSVQHATGAGTVRLWTEEDSLLCEIRDGGVIEEPLVGRVVPPADALGGRGIWIVNQLCDLVQVRSLPQGTAVRIHMRRP